jgi:hypothetical protein
MSEMNAVWIALSSEKYKYPLQNRKKNSVEAHPGVEV